MATAARASADIGLIGLAVMGQNLALNMADHGYQVAVYNRTTADTEKFVAGNGNTPGGLVGAAALPDFVAALKKPRKILILVKAGAPVDAVIEQLLGAGVEPDDIVMDCGNSLWTDTIRREKQYAERCRFFGSGVSGGEEGARFGPSLMPGGHPASWEHLRPIWEAIAAKVDPKTGKPLEGCGARQARHRRRAVHHVHRPQRRGPLREDGPQRDRVRRHAADLRGVSPPARRSAA